VRRPFFTDSEWRRLPRSARQAVVDSGLEVIWDDVAEAIDGGTFQARPDMHLSRTPVVVDEQGWGELRDALAALLEDADRIVRQSGERLAGADEAGIHARLVVMHFETPS
jgi:hypothetical protein